MRIHSESLIRHPQQTVYEAYRDRLPEIAAYIPDVKEILVEKRETVSEGLTKLHNVWIADRDIPTFAKAFIKPEMLRWDDFAEWRDSEHCVHWTLKLRVFSDQVTCGGTNCFIRAGDGQTTVRLEGDLDIDLKNIPSVPRMFAGGLKPKIEKFIVGLITPNLQQVNESLQQFLDDQA